MNNLTDEEIAKLEQIKQEQARIAKEEAEEMDNIAFQQRSKNKLADLQAAEREFYHNEGYEEKIFTQEQVDRAFKMFNGGYIGALISLNLFMFMMDQITPMLAFIFVTQGISALLTLNRNVTTFVWCSAAMAVYSYHSYFSYSAEPLIHGDFLAHLAMLTLQPVGFLMWSNQIAKQNREITSTYDPEHDQTGTKIHTKVAVRRMGSKEIIYSLVGFVIVYSIWYMLLSMQNIFSTFSLDQTTIPYLEIFMDTMMLMGAIFMNLRYREQWIVWIIVNSVGFWLWIGSKTPIMAGQFAILTVCCVMALYLWSLESKLAEQAKKPINN